MAISKITDPLRVFQVNGQVCQLKAAALNSSVANNQQVIAAVTGKRIRVMGGIYQSGGAAVSNIWFKSNSGGARLTADLRVPMIDNGENFFLPIVECGYYETSTGHGLFTDVATDSCNMTVFYIEYTP